MRVHRRGIATSETAMVETPKVEHADMHIPDTRLPKALIETRISEAERAAERDWSRANSPGVWKQVSDWWHTVRENLTNRPPSLPSGGHWYHRGLHH